MTTKRLIHVALAAVLATLVATPGAAPTMRATDADTPATLALRIGGSEAAGGFKESG